MDSGGAIPERVQEGTRILLGSGLEKIYFTIWQRTWLCLVYLFPENFRVPKFGNNRLNCLRENVKIVQVFILYGYYLLLSSRSLAREQQVEQKHIKTSSLWGETVSLKLYVRLLLIRLVCH